MSPPIFRAANSQGDFTRPTVASRNLGKIPNTTASPISHRIDEEFRASLLRDAFGSTPRPRPNVFSESPWSYSLWALAGSLTGCSNHPPLVDEGSSDSDGGDSPDAGRPPRDAGVPDAEIPDAGGDGDAGNTPEVCQVRLPMAVLFYDCVDMAREGEEPSRICLSEEKFGGDLAATHQFIEAGMASLRHLYSSGCSPFALDPVIFYPDRVLNGRLGDPDFEFRVTAFGTDGTPLYNYTHLPYRLSNDISLAGDDPSRFGIYAVLNGWQNTILPSAAPATYYMHDWPAPPHAVTSLNLHEGTMPDVPATLKWTLRHEGFHGTQAVALNQGFPRPLYVHNRAPICEGGGDSSWLCMAEYDTDGVPMHVEDWQTALGPFGVPITCDDPSWLAHCAETSAVMCGDIECPSLPSFLASCNSQGYCEYHSAAITAPWQSFNTFIYVPPGSTFNMGTNPDDPGHQANEAPVVAINFSRGYFIGQYEATIEAYEACRAAGACLARDYETWDANGWGMNHSASRPLHPVNSLNGNSAFALCEYLIPGGRLPIRPEWEFAARGPASFLYPYGNTEPTCADQQAGFNMLGTPAGHGCGTGGTHPINAMPNGVSPIGAWNTAGNVWEWTGGCWNDDYTSFPGNGLFSPECPSNYYADLAGGGFNDSALRVRPASRHRAYIFLASSNVGVRCAASASWVYE